MKSTKKSTDGTSYHFVNVSTTIEKLTAVLGAPQYDENTGEDKVNVEWNVETELGDVCTVYDWKEGRAIRRDETILFHIGAKSEAVALRASKELKALLK